MIELRNISKYYGSLQVLDNISFSVGRGEIVAIVGPSGAGKTTLLQIAGSLDSPDSGTVTYDGVEITGLKDRKLAEFRNTNIGFIFQFHELLPEFTAIENVAMPALIAGRKRKEAFAAARELLELLGLGERLNHRPAEMSGGEKQRTAIARALINNPRIIFADEPTGSLDSRNREEVQQIISELCKKRGHTFLIVTHDPSLASIAHRTINMADGRIISITSRPEPEPESIAKEPASELEVIVSVPDEPDADPEPQPEC